MRLDAAVAVDAVRAEGRGIRVPVRDDGFRAERQVRGRHDLDEVHEVVRRVVGRLVGVVERIEVVVRPGQLRAQVQAQLRGHLRAEAELVDLVREGVALVDGRVEIVVQVVHVHVAVAEAAARSDVEVPHDLVHPQIAFDPAALVALFVQSLPVVFSFALLDAFAPAKGPPHAGVGFADFVAGVTAARFRVAGWRVCAETASAILWIKMRGFFVFRMPGLCQRHPRGV